MIILVNQPMESENSADSVEPVRVYKLGNNNCATKMRVSERSKPFTIENILKDESKSCSDHKLVARLDFAASGIPPQLFLPNWMRLPHSPPAHQAHFFLGGLPGNY